MGHCPFCKGAIQEDMLVFGGSCPHCLIEIPGEEAPTDPGAQALARQQEEKAAASGSNKGRVAAAAVVALLIGAGAGWFVYSNQEQPEQLAQTDEWTMLSADAHQNVYEDEPEEAATRSNKGGGSSSVAQASSRQPSTGGQLASAGSGSPGRASLNPTGSLSEQVAAADPTQTVSTPGLMSGPSVSIGSRSAQEILKDPAAIEAMIKSVVSRNGRQLEDCYNDRLKIDESLQGRWSVSFTVKSSGKTSKIAVKGLNGADSELETCIQGKISRWQFKPIVEDVGMQRTYTFKP